MIKKINKKMFFKVIKFLLLGIYHFLKVKIDNLCSLIEIISCVYI